MTRRHLCAALAALGLGGQAPAAPPPERIAFPYPYAADLRGVLDALTAFSAACLRQPTTRDLGQRLAPAGYQIVTRDVHFWGKDQGAFPDTAILSRTGREEDDLAAGAPIIDLVFPNDKLPDGGCSVRWKRRWDTPADAPALSLSLAAQLPSRLSYQLRAVLLTAPERDFTVADRYDVQGRWMAPCLEAGTCTLYVNAGFDPEGIDLTLSRDAVARAEAPASDPAPAPPGQPPR